MAHLVEDLAIVGERLIPVRHSRRQVESAMVLGAQLDAVPATAGGRVGADRRHVEAGPPRNAPPHEADAPHAAELRLGMGLGLVVHAPDRVATGVEGGVALRDIGLSPRASNASASKVRANQPRSSPSRSTSITQTPGRGVCRNLISLPPTAERRPARPRAAGRDRRSLPQASVDSRRGARSAGRVAARLIVGHQQPLLLALPERPAALPAGSGR